MELGTVGGDLTGLGGIEDDDWLLLKVSDPIVIGLARPVIVLEE